MTFKQKLFTVWVFTKLSSKRFFRDKTALFFGIAFPLIFLFVFGGLSSGSGNISFNVAVINSSNTQFSKDFVKSLEKNKVFKVNEGVNSLDVAKEKMSRSQLDATIVLPSSFGQTQGSTPSGQVEVYYTQNNSQSGQALISVLNSVLSGVNAKFVTVTEPFTVVDKKLSNKSLTAFDYAFAGVLGFAIVGMGIFGPINVFPELKKQGILRRLHTTPIRVWQYFLSTMASQAFIGLISIGIMFVAAITFLHLHVTGNYLAIAFYVVLSIVLILGIGLSIGGWAKNERQAAPLANMIVFPMLFLSGTFFPRFLMPELLQKITAFLPLTPVIDGIRMLTTEGKTLLDLGPQLALMAVWMVIIYFIAFRIFRWE